ncbi:MAG: FHA domain-containing protein [Oscillatoriales cyanobacterium RM1_1_9]|nr:FHA domain-containing protein [Oscillatoriales cyanobacterium RM1_1_9]
MITLNLLHPNQLIAVRSWTFDQENTVRVGRSVRNHVVLYSAIVSRCHLELIQDYQGWKVVNLGTNGTYINGQPVHECRVEDGQIIQIALSGPKIQLKIQPEPSFSSRTPNLTTQKTP